RLEDARRQLLPPGGMRVDRMREVQKMATERRNSPESTPESRAVRAAPREDPGGKPMSPRQRRTEQCGYCVAMPARLLPDTGRWQSAVSRGAASRGTRLPGGRSIDQHRRRK